MASKKQFHHGFTMIELCAVIAILGILASIAAVAYAHFRTPDYDNEAMAGINALYSQAQNLVNEFGISKDDSQYRIKAACHKTTEALANAGLQLPSDGVHHWKYSVCFGFFADDRPGYLVAATGNDSGLLNSSQKNRLFILSSSMDSPVTIDNSILDLPPNARLATPNVTKTADLF